MAQEEDGDDDAAAAFTWCGPAWSVWRCSTPSTSAPGWSCHSLGGADAALHASARLLLLRGPHGDAAQDRLLLSLQARHDIAVRPARLPFADDPGGLLNALLPPPGSAECAASPCRLAWTPPPGVAPGLRTLTVALPPNAVNAAATKDEQQHAGMKLMASLRSSLRRTLGLELGESDAGCLQLVRISTSCASLNAAPTPMLKFASEEAAPAVLDRIALLFSTSQQQQQQQQL